jgi:hypothetical protein
VNVGQIRARIQAKIGDTAGAEAQPADILNWINDGIQEIGRRTNQPQGTATTPTVVAQTAYNLSTFAADIIRIRSVMLDGSVLQPLSIEEADTYLADREKSGQSNGTPSFYWLWADQINLWPAPDTAGKLLKVFYQKRPAAVAADGDTPGIPLHMHADLVDYVYAQVLETTGEREAASRRMDRFDGTVREASSDADWPIRGTYPHVAVSLDDVSYFG